MATRRSSHRRTARRALVTAIALGPLLGGVAPGPAEAMQIRYGDPVRVGNGTVRSYVVVQEGKPVEVGIELDSAALEGLPAPRDVPRMAGHEDMHEYLVAMPADNPTPYKVLELDWNPQGHHPHVIYGIPHFDFHFYTIDTAARNAIDPADSAWKRKMNRLPDSVFVPAGYTYAGQPFGAPIDEATVPRMGVHWTHRDSPELQPTNPQRFTHTFLIGTWDGRVIFHEPMITRETLQSGRAIEMPVPVAQRHEQPGYYTSGYRIAYDPATRTHRVALTGLAWRQ